MATDLHNDREKRAEKATALLTLAADQGKVRGPCLKGEEMAALVEGRSGGAELPVIWNHLSTCSRCYEEWLFLKASVKDQAPRGRLYHLRRWKKFRYLGTALAAAASIAVYLNIVSIEEKGVEQAVLPPTIHLQDKNLAIPPQGQSGIQEEKSNSAPLAQQAPAVLPAAPLAVPEATGSGTAKGRLAGQPQEDRQKPAVAPMVAAGRVAKDLAVDSAGSLAERAMAPAAAPALENIAGWLEQLRAACLSGRKETQFWRDMAVRGMALQASQAGVPTGVAQGKTAAVLTLVQGISGPDTVPQQCKLILAELAEPSNNK